jgi:hypothetical protein
MNVMSDNSSHSNVMSYNSSRANVMSDRTAGNDQSGWNYKMQDTELLCGQRGFSGLVAGNIGKVANMKMI